jgi:hypothetical protein
VLSWQRTLESQPVVVLEYRCQKYCLRVSSAYIKLITINVLQINYCRVLARVVMVNIAYPM